MTDLNSLYSDEADISSEEFYLKHERALKGTEERFLNGDNTDDEGWRSEALAVIADIKPFVKEINISDVLPCDENGIYLNLETKECASLTVELSCAGFRVCGYKFDTLDSSEDEKASAGNNVIPLNIYYETPYALLDSISPAYRDSFSNELAQKLTEVLNGFNNSANSAANATADT